MALDPHRSPAPHSTAKETEAHRGPLLRAAACVLPGRCQNNGAALSSNQQGKKEGEREDRRTQGPRSQYGKAERALDRCLEQGLPIPAQYSWAIDAKQIAERRCSVVAGEVASLLFLSSSENGGDNVTSVIGLSEALDEVLHVKS